MGDGVRCWLVAAALLSVAPALAADLPAAPEPKSAPAQTPAAGGALAPPAAACREWTDGCRVCLRAADGTVSCSNVGIACVLKAVNCTTSDVPAR
jgi:hypothetical protein